MDIESDEQNASPYITPEQAEEKGNQHNGHHNHHQRYVRWQVAAYYGRHRQLRVYLIEYVR